jgi:hypothetical protein
MSEGEITHITSSPAKRYRISTLTMFFSFVVGSSGVSADATEA